MHEFQVLPLILKRDQLPPPEPSLDDESLVDRLAGRTVFEPPVHLATVVEKHLAGHIAHFHQALLDGVVRLLDQALHLQRQRPQARRQHQIFPHSHLGAAEPEHPQQRMIL